MMKRTNRFFGIALVVVLCSPCRDSVVCILLSGVVGGVFRHVGAVANKYLRLCVRGPHYTIQRDGVSWQLYDGGMVKQGITRK